MNIIRTIDYDEFERKKRFNIEPSRRFSVKATDEVQMRMFMKMQKNLPAFWRSIGVTSIETMMIPEDWEKQETAGEPRV